METGDIEDPVGGEKGDGVGEGGVDSEYLLELEYLLGDDGGDALHFNSLNKYNFRIFENPRGLDEPINRLIIDLFVGKFVFDHGSSGVVSSMYGYWLD